MHSTRFLVALSLFFVFGRCTEPGSGPEHAPRDLNSGWTYRLEQPGDDPARPPDRDDWRPYKPGTNLYPQYGGTDRFIWVRVEYTDGGWHEPHVFLKEPFLGIHEVYVDGLLIKRIAELGDSAWGQQLRRYWPILPLPSARERSTLLLRLTMRGSFPTRAVDGVLIGEEDDLRLFYLFQHFDRTLLGVLFCGLGTFVLFIYFFRRETIYIAFSALGISIGLLSTLDQEMAFYSSGLTPDVYYDWIQTIMLAIPIGLLAFIEQILGPGPLRWLRRAWQYHLALFLILPPLFFLDIFQRWEVAPVFFGSAAVWLVAIPIVAVRRAYQRPDVEVRIFTGVLLVLVAAFGHDILKEIGFISGGNTWFYWGTWLFLVGLAIIIVRRFFDAQRKLERHAEELETTNRSMARFVPAPFLEFIGRRAIVEVKLGDQVQKEMAVLFSDIRSFTTLSESMSPGENFEFINDYLQHMGPVIRRHGGFIDKYIGDAIMALFPGPVDDALRAALDMQRELKAFNARREHTGADPVRAGIGIHAGSLMLGMIGEKERLEGTVISDAVNLASRLEGMTKKLGRTGILISEETSQRVREPENFSFLHLGRARVKGRREPVRIYELSAAASGEASGES